MGTQTPMWMTLQHKTIFCSNVHVYIFKNIYWQICSLIISNTEKDRLHTITCTFFFGHFILCQIKNNKKKSKETNTQTNKQKNRETNQQNHSSSKLKRTSFLTAFMGPQKEEDDKSMWTLDPPNYIAWHLCVLIQSDQKRPSSWHNHCFLPHKEQNLQVRGGGDLFLYKGNFIPCLCTCFCFVGCRIWESLLDEARGNPDLRWEKSSFWHLGNRRLFFAIFSPSLQDGNVFFVTFAYFF